VRATLPSGLLANLEGVARCLRVNLQAVLLAGLQTVLLRYSGLGDLVIGVPVAGRDRLETHGLVGYFINTLPVRCTASEGATFQDMVVNASKATLAALEHSVLPLEEVLAASGVARVSNVNPLFQVLFQYMPEDGENEPIKLGDGELQPYQHSGGLAHAKMDLTFTMAGGKVSLDYMSEMYDGATIERIYSSFVSVLEHCVTDPAVQALAIDILGSQAEAVAAFSIGKERPHYVQTPLAHESFEAIAAQSPERNCLCYEGKWMSYGEVEARASAIAAQLCSLGVGPGVTVGVMLHRSFELVISMLAVLKAGGYFLPCDPDYPDDRLAIYLEDGKALVTLVHGPTVARAKEMVDPSVTIINVEDVAASDSKSSVKLKRASKGDPAYVIFTSGSTGRPKGVLIDHTALIDFVNYNLEYYSEDENCVSVLSVTINFDPCIMQVWRIIHFNSVSVFCFLIVYRRLVSMLLLAPSLPLFPFSLSYSLLFLSENCRYSLPLLLVVAWLLHALAVTWILT
jgi:non-ribosomal peptide synthetase component F